MKLSHGWNRAKNKIDEQDQELNMGQQQLLLLVLGVIIIGIAIVLGINLFQAGAEQSAKDQLVSQAIVIGSNAQQYYKKPTTMGGGGNAFTGYVIPTRMVNVSNGSFAVTAVAQTATLTGTPTPSLNYTWTVTTTVTADSIFTVVN